MRDLIGRVVLLVMMAVTTLGAVACGPRIITVDHAVPSDVQLQLSRVSRIWIAGFHATGNREVDLNRETASLVRNEPRRTTSLDVVDAEPLLIAADSVFADRRYWQRLASEYGAPLRSSSGDYLVARSTGSVGSHLPCRCISS